MSCSGKKAFTLIELLVVISIIAMLLAILMPALSRVKKMAAAAVCLSNEKQLVLGWLLYAEDFGGKFVDGDTSDATGASAGYSNYGKGAVHNWVGMPLSETFGASNKSIEDKVRGLEVGALWDYLENHKVYHCPGDGRSRERANGINVYGYRTYSIGKPLSARPANSSGEDAVTISRVSQFQNGSNKIVFLEETEKSSLWNHKTWNMNLLQEKWIDPFAILHNDSSTFAFADGHADRHKWTQERTRDMAEKGVKNWDVINTSTHLGSTAEDYYWFKKSYIPGR
ncbi:MAG: type II secretion system protein [Anaerohalosphaera sp.]|nr:type II secretion system protein [Anaerohalosphaera sp.]